LGIDERLNIAKLAVGSDDKALELLDRIPPEVGFAVNFAQDQA